ncbi:degs1, partial [Symbiodinium microadriaticum]
LFKRYHMEHHQFQGSLDKDTDVPTEWEGRFFRGPILKTLWVFLQPIAYAFRPMMGSPKTPKKLDFINWVVIIAFDALIIYLWGPVGGLYPVVSSVLGFGLHPMAGHLIAEHFVFKEGFETYSYYGPLNYFAWNVGYHNEHHDFPRVPGWKLPMVKKIAPEYYDNLPTHSSWPGAIWKFITDPSMTPFNRIVRGRKYKDKRS